jgi:hypothetical protein
MKFCEMLLALNLRTSTDYNDLMSQRNFHPSFPGCCTNEVCVEILSPPPDCLIKRNFTTMTAIKATAESNEWQPRNSFHYLIKTISFAATLPSLYSDSVHFACHCVDKSTER